MTHTTLNISFYCRPSRADKEGFAPIELSIIINGTRELVTLPRKERPERFKNAVVSRRRTEIQDYLEAVRGRLNTILTEMMEQGILLTAKALRNYYQYGGVQFYTIQKLFDEYLAIIYKKDGTELTHRTVRKYEMSRDKFYTVIDKDKPVAAITSTVIAEYMRILRLEFNSVTTAGYAQKVKAVVKYGMSKGVIKINPFVGIHIRKEDKDVQFLSEEELAQIRDTDFKNDSINRIRDLFIFQASSGLSYCDMATLVPEDFQFNTEGNVYIHKRRAKTNIFYTSVVLQDGVNVLEKYNYSLPIISNNKYNSYLKFIKDICQIDKPLHTHIARHTYATRCINAGIRLEVVQKLMGHTSSRQCLHYAKLVEKSIVDEVNEAFSLQKGGRNYRAGVVKNTDI